MLIARLSGCLVQVFQEDVHSSSDNVREISALSYVLQKCYAYLTKVDQRGCLYFSHVGI